MPTAAAFRLAASRFDELAGECRSLDSGIVGTDADGALAGRSRVRERVTAALESALDASESIADVCAELAAIARERADACDAYEAAMRSYHAAHHVWSGRQLEWRYAQMDPSRPRADWPGTEPVPPPRPAFYSAGSVGAGPR